MLTKKQLKELRETNVTGLNYGDYELMLGEIARLTRHNQRMSAALAQLSDKENWLYPSPEWNVYDWIESNINPIELAERALVEDE